MFPDEIQGEFTCKWTILFGQASTIKIKFTNVSIQSTHGTCNEAYIEISTYSNDR